MSRYNTIAETFDFRQRAVLNGTRGIRHGVTPARIEKRIYRYVRSTRYGQPVQQSQVSLSARLTLVPVSMRAHIPLRERERERGE